MKFQTVAFNKIQFNNQILLFSRKDIVRGLIDMYGTAITEENEAIHIRILLTQAEREEFLTWARKIEERLRDENHKIEDSFIASFI